MQKPKIGGLRVSCVGCGSVDGDDMTVDSIAEYRIPFIIVALTHVGS
jgi:hypothetical protein